MLNELEALQQQLNEVVDVPEAVIKERGIPARIAKKKAVEEGRRQ